MTDTGYRFPFGESVTLVEQADRSPKRVFVLGVYASAVHARWTGPDGAQRVGALAVASEPEIFWRGDGAGGIIERIPVPPEAGRLTEYLRSPGSMATGTEVTWSLLVIAR